MTSIGASTVLRVKKPKAPKSKDSVASAGIKTKKLGVPIKVGSKAPTKAGSKARAKGAAASGGRRRSVAPKLKPGELARPERIAELRALNGTALRDRISHLLHHALGERSPFADGIAAPHTASDTRSRGAAAADLAVAARELGVVRILKRCGVLGQVEGMLLPQGIGAVFSDGAGGGMRKIASGMSLSGMSAGDDNSAASSYTGLTDSRKGKVTPADGREGSLLILRALCEIVGRPAEPFVVPFLAAALDESSSSSGNVREASEDLSGAIVALANPLAMKGVVCPVLFEALKSPEWRVKANALERLSQCAVTAPRQIGLLLPKIIPAVSSEVWDTKPQVTKASKDTLIACCATNANADINPAIPAIVNAICKPSDTMKAVDELKSTTFVASVDASTLSILCPILSRGLKEKQALSKRSCCIVIENMSRLVDAPSSAAPFGPLLVPELKRVAENVQFGDIRDAALDALKALTKALGHASVDAGINAIMADEMRKVEAEQARIDKIKEEDARREEEDRLRDEEERRQFRLAMDAQRALDQIAAKEVEEKKAEELKKKEKLKKSTKSEDGKCQSCGLKKCRKTCLFYSE